MGDYDYELPACGLLGIMLAMPHTGDGPENHASRSLMLPARLELDTDKLMKQRESGILASALIQPKCYVAKPGSGSSTEELQTSHDLIQALATAQLNWKTPDKSTNAQWQA